MIKYFLNFAVWLGIPLILSLVLCIFMHGVLSYSFCVIGLAGNFAPIGICGAIIQGILIRADYYGMEYFASITTVAILTSISSSFLFFLMFEGVLLEDIKDIIILAIVFLILSYFFAVISYVLTNKK